MIIILFAFMVFILRDTTVDSKNTEKLTEIEDIVQDIEEPKITEKNFFSWINILLIIIFLIILFMLFFRRPPPRKMTTQQQLQLRNRLDIGIGSPTSISSLNDSDLSPTSTSSVDSQFNAIPNHNEGQNVHGPGPHFFMNASNLRTTRFNPLIFLRYFVMILLIFIILIYASTHVNPFGPKPKVYTIY